MKFCETCCSEISTKDGENECSTCAENEARLKRNARRRMSGQVQLRRERESILRDCGLTKVRGALGGVYWE